MKECFIYFLFDHIRIEEVKTIVKKYASNEMFDEIMYSKNINKPEDLQFSVPFWIKYNDIDDFFLLAKKEKNIYSTLYFSGENCKFSCFTITVASDSNFIIGFSFDLDNYAIKKQIKNLEEEYKPDMVSKPCFDTPPISKKYFYNILETEEYPK